MNQDEIQQMIERIVENGFSVVIDEFGMTPTTAAGLLEAQGWHVEMTLINKSAQKEIVFAPELSSWERFKHEFKLAIDYPNTLDKLKHAMDDVRNDHDNGITVMEMRELQGKALPPVTLLDAEGTIEHYDPLSCTLTLQVGPGANWWPIENAMRDKTYIQVIIREESSSNG